MRKIYAICFIPAVLFSTASFSQSYSLFLKIEGIQGNSLDERHKNEINVFSYSTGVSSCPESNNGGSKACKPVITDLNLMMQMDRATIPLKMAVLQGKVIPNADFVLETGGKTGFTFFRMHMEEVTVTSVQESGSGGGDSRPTVSTSVSFSRVAWQYIEQNADGNATVKTSGGWDLKANKPWAYAPFN